MMWTACGQPGMIGHEISVRDAAATVVSEGPTRYHWRIRSPLGAACLATQAPSVRLSGYRLGCQALVGCMS
jgi:hypothetical protein